VKTKTAIGVLGVMLALVLLVHRSVQASPPSQLSDVVEIIGSTLRIQVFSNASLQVFHRDYSHGAAYGRNASGPFIAIGSEVHGPIVPIGPGVTEFTPIGNEGPLGRGTSADPFRLVSTQRLDAGGADLGLVQTVSYVNGENRFRLDWRITNNGSQQTCFKFYHAADLYFADSDLGYGFYDRRSGAVGGFNEQRDWFMVFIPVVPADHYREASFGAIWADISSADDFDDTISSEYRDNGAGLQWNVCLPAGQSTSLGDLWSFGASELEAISTVSAGFRPTGPLVPELTTFIPTPLDLSADPGVIGANVLFAALAMIPFTAASGLLTRLLGKNQALVLRRLRPVRWIAGLQQRLGMALRTRLSRPSLAGAARLLGIVFFYGLVFSLLDRSWNPFSLAGLWLFLSMTIAYGVVGIAVDIVQWLAARRWGVPADLTLRPTSVLLAILSMATSRVFGLVPGLMFGTPEALDVDPAVLDRQRETKLVKIAAGTLLVIGIGAWLPTAATALVQRLTLPEVTLTLIAGAESFLLVIFAVTVENGFVQMLPLPGNVGYAFRRWNRWLWAGGLMAIAFVFFHTLLNPRGDLAAAMREANVRFFILAVVVFVAGVAALWLYFKWLENRGATVAETASPLPPVAEDMKGKEIPEGPVPGEAEERLKAEELQPRGEAEGSRMTAGLAHPEGGLEEPDRRGVQVAVDARIFGLKQPDAGKRESALYELVGLGPGAVGPLILYLQNPDPYARLMAAAALGRLHDPAAVEPLRQAVQDPDEGVGYMAGVALKELSTHRPSPAPKLRSLEAADRTAGTAKCPSCAEDIEAGATACRSCGAQLAPAKPEPAGPPGTEISRAAPSTGSRNWRTAFLVLALVAAVGCGGGILALVAGGGDLSRLVALIVTPTPTPTLTPTPIPTATPLPTPTPDAATPLPPDACGPVMSAALEREPGFQESFSNANAAEDRWGPLCPGCTLTGGALRMDVAANQGDTGIPIPAQATDLALQFEFVPRSASDTLTVAVWFRIVGPGNMYGVFFYPATGYWRVDVLRQSSWTPFLGGTTAGLGQGVRSRVLIIGWNDRFAIFSNDQLLACFQDPGPLTGNSHILGVLTDSGPVQVDFDNVAVWDLEGVSDPQ